MNSSCRNSYNTLKNTWSGSKENFFVSYAVRGPVLVPSMGLEAGIPVRHPISGTVQEPSPLNSQYLFDYNKKCSCNR